MSPEPHSTTTVHNSSKNSFNYYITKFFLENTRLTLLCFILVVIVGVIATISSKTSGFPNPEIGVAIVQTIYPGASSETVASEVTQPLEGAVKEVDGVKNYSSFSNNSVSVISITMDENANYDSVQNKIDSAVKSVSLPTGAETPKVTKPDIGGPSIIFSVAGNDPAKIYDTYTKAVKDLNQFPETAKVSPFVDLKKQAIIKIDLTKMRAAGIGVDQVSAQVKTIRESIPVVSDISLDNKNYSIVTSVSGNSLFDIKNLEFAPGSAGGTTQVAPNAAASLTPNAPSPVSVVKLSSFAEVTTEYNFSDDKTNIAFRNTDEAKVYPAVVFEVKAVKDTDLNAYTSKISDKFKSYSNSEYLIGKDIKDAPNDKTLLIENFSVNDQNQEQVNEVIGGLIGSKLASVDGPAANLGWLLGGIQLVFLVMLAFVSWRAAIIAAISIPLSLVFSIIYLYFTGQSLNTLVLFSLVLVIGLVVDPALVILEAIQRKVDTGLHGKEAVLEAVKDVGNGLFLATLTNIIVFLPFAVISGIIGKIFAYIPLTVIPATIGSYVVPLIFLSWLGGLILKPNKNRTSSEEENLWPVAKWLIDLNQRILNGSRVVRIAIILVALIVPLSVAGYYFSSGQLKATQFASNDNANALGISGSFLSTVSKEDREQITQEIYKIAVNDKDVKQAFPISAASSPTALDIYLELEPVKNRDQKSIDIAKYIKQKIQNKFGENASSPKFFDLNVGVEQTGPPTSTYQVSTSIKTDNLQTLETASVRIGQSIMNLCQKEDKTIVFDANCADDKKIVKKVDDGFTNKQNKVVEVLLNRQKLQQAQLTVPNAPLSILVNQQLKQLFEVGDSKALITVSDNGTDLEVVLDKTQGNPKTLEEIKNFVVVSTAGKQVKLSDVAQINEKTPKSSIQRVKGQTVGVIQVALKEGYTDQATSAQVSTAIVNYYKDQAKTDELGLDKGAIEEYSEGDTASSNKSFSELLVALVLAIFFTYVVLAVFFKSLTQPLVVLFTIPLTFLGMFPALVYLGTGEIGFLEIIGVIILIGIVENVAIFLIDAARQKIENEGWDEKKAISFASGVRLRPVLMTKFTAVASLAPLAILSQFYRSIALVIIFGLITSGFLSLITTPILFIFFKWLSKKFIALKWYNKIFFFPLFPIYIIVMAVMDKKSGKAKIQPLQIDSIRTN